MIVLGFCERRAQGTKFSIVSSLGAELNESPEIHQENVNFVVGKDTHCVADCRKTEEITGMPSIFTLLLQKKLKHNALIFR